MVLHVCRHQKNRMFDYVHDFVRYLFWHRLLLTIDSFGITVKCGHVWKLAEGNLRTEAIILNVSYICSCSHWIQTFVQS